MRNDTTQPYAVLWCMWRLLSYQMEVMDLSYQMEWVAFLGEERGTRRGRGTGRQEEKLSDRPKNFHTRWRGQTGFTKGDGRRLIRAGARSTLPNHTNQGRRGWIIKIATVTGSRFLHREHERKRRTDHFQREEESSCGRDRGNFLIVSNRLLSLVVRSNTSRGHRPRLRPRPVI